MNILFGAFNLKLRVQKSMRHRCRQALCARASRVHRLRYALPGPHVLNLRLFPFNKRGFSQRLKNIIRFW